MRLLSQLRQQEIERKRRYTSLVHTLNDAVCDSYMYRLSIFEILIDLHLKSFEL